MINISLFNVDSEQDRSKLERIYDMYSGTMLKVAKQILSDDASAEDAVSDSIETIIKNLHKITDISCHKTRAYIVIIVRTRAIDLLRKRGSHPEEFFYDFNFSDNSDSLDTLTMKESYNGILEHIRALPKSLSDVLYLSAVLENSTEEISELLDISKDAVRQRLSRAKAEVRKKLEQEGIRYARK